MPANTIRIFVSCYNDNNPICYCNGGLEYGYSYKDLMYRWNTSEIASPLFTG